jgi:hypothetical protein|nr:MAG TPA: hypothetical protein [Caudoviricetes sp.]
MKRKIKDSNDFFGYLISIKNKDNNVVLGRISKDYGDSAIDDFIDYINELEEMKYIKINSLEDIHIVKSKEHNYISPFKKIIDYIGPKLVYVLVYFMGLCSPIFTEYLKKILGIS